MAYLISIAINALIWFVSFTAIGSYLEDSVTLSSMDVATFKQIYFILLSIAAFLSVLGICYWIYYGSTAKAASEPETSQKIWMTLFVLLILTAVVEIVIAALVFSGEGVTVGQYLIISLVLSFQSFLSFWIASLFLSPINVKYIPPLASKLR